MARRIAIRRLRLLAGAQEADGHAVIVDVLRAATSAAVALAGGVAQLVLVDTAEAAFDLRRARYPDALLAGESEGRQLAGFDLDNSPTALERTALAGRTLILRTSAGTQGVLRASGAEAVYLAAFVNAGATVRRLEQRGARAVSLVAMGIGGTRPAEEDEACAAYLESLLRGRPLPVARLVENVLRRKEERWSHPAPTFLEDVERAFAVDRYDFAIEVGREDGLAVARRA